MLPCNTPPMTSDKPQILPIRPTWQALSKVPAVTVSFWVIKILTTGMGETASDFLTHRIGPFPAVALSGLGLLVALALQFFARRYVTWIYWLAVVMVSVFGTLAADAAHVGLGIPYLASTVAFSVALAVVFAIWYRFEGTLSIHSVRTRQREAFYWATVLTTFALGTAAGDMAARTMGLGWFAAGLMFATLIAIPAVLHSRFGLNEITAFWWAYILTRPLGASFADWVAVGHAQGGLALGTGTVTLVLMGMIVFGVSFMAVAERK